MAGGGRRRGRPGGPSVVHREREFTGDGEEEEEEEDDRDRDRIARL